MSSQTRTKITEIRNVQIQDTDAVRELTLQMLTDSPHAFGDTLTEAQARTDTDWSRYVQGMISPPDHNAFIAFNEQGACGFVAGDAANLQTPPETVLISHLWVASQQRGTGLGRQLMDAVTKWAMNQNARRIALGVTEMNPNAIKFYEHLGYIDTGLRFPLRWDETKHIIILGRQL